MFTRLASYLLGGAAQESPAEELAPEEPAVAVPAAATPPTAQEQLRLRQTEVEGDDWILIDRNVEGGAGMDESWYVTPPACFTRPGPVHVETSPLENLLIEHPSMSVYRDAASSSAVSNGSLLEASSGIGSILDAEVPASDEVDGPKPIWEPKSSSDKQKQQQQPGSASVYSLLSWSSLAAPARNAPAVPASGSTLVPRGNLPRQRELDERRLPKCKSPARRQQQQQQQQQQLQAGTELAKRPGQAPAAGQDEQYPSWPSGARYFKARELDKRKAEVQLQPAKDKGAARRLASLEQIRALGAAAARMQPEVLGPRDLNVVLVVPSAQVLQAAVQGPPAERAQEKRRPARQQQQQAVLEQRPRRSAATTTHNVRDMRSAAVDENLRVAQIRSAQQVLQKRSTQSAKRNRLDRANKALEVANGKSRRPRRQDRMCANNSRVNNNRKC